MTLQQQIAALDEKMTQIEDAMRFLFSKLDMLTEVFRETDARLKAALSAGREDDDLS